VIEADLHRPHASEAAGDRPRVAAGEEVEVVRNGAPVAVIGPPRARLISAERFRELLASAPGIDDKFADALRAVRQSAGPPEDRWDS
jgi:antitoxin (DNA-binding transcriptional repressor) of toxin-antitoxin stability system